MFRGLEILCFEPFRVLIFSGFSSELVDGDRGTNLVVFGERLRDFERKINTKRIVIKTIAATIPMRTASIGFTTICSMLPVKYLQIFQYSKFMQIKHKISYLHLHVSQVKKVSQQKAKLNVIFLWRL